MLLRIKDVLNDLGAEQRRGTSDVITVYRPTFAMDSGKNSAISNEIYDLFESYFKDHFSSYDVFYAALFKKYIERGLFDEFGIDVFISRLNSRTIDHLIHRLDLRYFDNADKALQYADLPDEVLRELDPNVKELVFYEIKLLLE